MKFIGNIDEVKDLVTLEKLNEIKDDSLEVVISSTEPTGDDRKPIWVDTSADASTFSITPESIGAYPASSVMYGTSLPTTVTEGAIFLLYTA